MSNTALTLLEFKKLLVSSLKLQGVEPESIADDEPVIGGRLGLDSIDALEMVIAVERRLGGKIRLDDLEPEAFKSVAGMYDSVMRYLSGGPERTR